MKISGEMQSHLTRISFSILLTFFFGGGGGGEGGGLGR